MDIIIIFKTNEHGYRYKSQETRFSYYVEVKQIHYWLLSYTYHSSQWAISSSA